MDCDVPRLSKYSMERPRGSPLDAGSVSVAGRFTPSEIFVVGSEVNCVHIDLDGFKARGRVAREIRNGPVRIGRPAHQRDAGRGFEDSLPHRSETTRSWSGNSGYSPVVTSIALPVVTGRKPRPRTARSVELAVVTTAPGWSISRDVVTRTPPAEYLPLAGRDDHGMELRNRAFVPIGPRIGDIVRDGRQARWRSRSVRPPRH